jgi:hypothetical protein
MAPSESVSAIFIHAAQLSPQHPACAALHVTVRGRWSAFYRKIKRAEFEERQRRVIARQRKNKISIVNESELPSRQIARPS